MMLAPEELVAWDRAGPRYTSYPTVPRWTELDPSLVRRALARAQPPAQVYAHVPFCREQCWFCGCTQVVAGRRDAGDKYLDAISRQVLTMPSLEVDRVHLGGGTPTWLDVEQLGRLWAILRSRFSPTDDAELSIEADPEVTSIEQLDLLGEQGFRRLSLGVQSFDPKVLAAVNRPQLSDRVAPLLEHVRGKGWWGLNLDLMYGLPHQDLASFSGTLETILELRPDRVAVFGYAHVPWLKRHQRQMDASALPDSLERARCLIHAQERFREAGYLPIGMDHFALPDDELARADQAGTLHRNFMGYTTRPVDMIGLGPSAISEVAGVYWQDEPGLAPWMRKAGGDLVHRGWQLTLEDRLRRQLINGLMCQMQVDLKALGVRYGLDVRERFSSELDQLAPMVDEGLVEFDGPTLRITERGRPLMRLAAMPFDEHLSAGRFSKTV
jgi:oxygen-independent coproporphyrinogen-3 oxidase